MADDFLPDMDKQDVKVVGLATGLGCSVVASLVVFIAGGLLLDQWLDTSPVFTLIGVAIGLLGAGYQLWELVLVSDKNRQSGPIGKKMAQRLQNRRVDDTQNDHRE